MNDEIIEHWFESHPVHLSDYRPGSVIACFDWALTSCTSKAGRCCSVIHNQHDWFSTETNYFTLNFNLKYVIQGLTSVTANNVKTQHVLIIRQVSIKYRLRCTMFIWIILISRNYTIQTIVIQCSNYLNYTKTKVITLIHSVDSIYLTFVTRLLKSR